MTKKIVAKMIGRKMRPAIILSHLISDKMLLEVTFGVSFRCPATRRMRQAGSFAPRRYRRFALSRIPGTGPGSRSGIPCANARNLAKARKSVCDPGHKCGRRGASTGRHADSTLRKLTALQQTEPSAAAPMSPWGPTRRHRASLSPTSGSEREADFHFGPPVTDISAGSMRDHCAAVLTRMSAALIDTYNNT